MDKYMRNVFIGTIAALVFCSLTGCVSFNRDVSRNASLWGGYKYKNEYTLHIDVFLIRTDNDGLILIPESSMTRGLGRSNMSPNSINDYKKDPVKGSFLNSTWVTGEINKYKLDVVGIVIAGTRLKCTKLKEQIGWNWMFGYGKRLSPYVTIVNGPFAGTVANIRDISIYYKENGMDVFVFKPEEGVIADAPL